jgi:hypothetical protein
LEHASNNSMDRLERIAQLKQEADDGRAELARRAAEREADPVLQQQWLMASEPIRRAPMRENDDGLALVYRTQDDATSPVPEPEPVPSDTDAAVDNLIETADLIQDQVDRLKRENIALKAKLDVVLTLLGKSDTLSNAKAADVIDLPDWRKRADAA